MGSNLDRPEFKPRPLDYIEFLTWRTSLTTLGGGAFAFFSVFEGELDEPSVLHAWLILCLRHPMLGATIQDDLGVPHFVPLPEFPLPQVRTTSSTDVVEELLASVGEVEFPPGAPLYQPFALLNPSTGRHAFLTVINHAGGDGDACIKVHKEFAEILNTIGSYDENRPAINRALPPSWCETLLPKQQPWRYVRSGTIELARWLHCDLVPFENPAPFAQRRTRHFVAIADAVSTQSLIKRAAEQQGLNAFLSAALLQAQFSYMADRGLIGNRARLILTLPMNLRRFAEPNSWISMGTFPHFAGVALERNTDLRSASQRVRTAIDTFTGPDAFDRLVNWYSPLLTRMAIELIAKSNFHFGPYTTHLGRLDLARNDRLRRVTSFGYLQMRHCFSSLQASTRILNNRLVVAMNYCEPVVSLETAQGIFREFLSRIEIIPSAVTDNYDDYVRSLLEGERATA